MKTRIVGWAFFTAAMAASILLGWADVEKVQRVLAEIGSDSLLADPPAREHRLTEADLNAYIALELRQKRPPGIQEMSVRLLGQGRLGTFMKIDPNQLGLKNAAGLKAWLSILMSGTQDLEFEGVLTSGQGKARYQIERVQLNGYPVPAALVEALLQSWGRSLEPPIDFSEPFDLPHPIQQIDIDPGQVTIHTGGPAG